MNAKKQPLTDKQLDVIADDVLKKLESLPNAPAPASSKPSYNRWKAWCVVCRTAIPEDNKTPRAYCICQRTFCAPCAQSHLILMGTLIPDKSRICSHCGIRNVHQWMSDTSALRREYESAEYLKSMVKDPGDVENGKPPVYGKAYEMALAILDANSKYLGILHKDLKDAFGTHPSGKPVKIPFELKSRPFYDWRFPLEIETLKMVVSNFVMQECGFGSDHILKEIGFGHLLPKESSSSSDNVTKESSEEEEEEQQTHDEQPVSTDESVKKQDEEPSLDLEQHEEEEKKNQEDISQEENTEDSK